MWMLDLTDLFVKYVPPLGGTITTIVCSNKCIFVVARSVLIKLLLLLQLLAHDIDATYFSFGHH